MAGARFSCGFQRIDPHPPAFFFKSVNTCCHYSLLYRSVCDAISEDTDTLDFNFDHIAGLHGLRSSRRTRVNDIARHKSHKPADVVDDVVDRENQIAGSLRLYDRTVQTALHVQVVVIQTLNNARAESTERIRTFRAEPLKVAFLPVTLAYIVSRSYSEDMFWSLRNRNVFAFLPDDDDQFGFVVDVVSAFGNNDVLFGSDNARTRFPEEPRFLRRFEATIGNVAFVVPAHRSDF